MRFEVIRTIVAATSKFTAKEEKRVRFYVASKTLKEIGTDAYERAVIVDPFQL